MDQLTDPPLVHHLRRKPKYRNHLCHDLPEQLRHFRRDWNTGVTVEALEEKLNTLEEISQSIITRDSILHRLG
jgi:hypothetical protein